MHIFIKYSVGSIKLTCMKYDEIIDRREAILQYIISHRVVTIKDIIEFSGASGSTVRRDIDWLEEHDKVRRHHGSVYVAETQYDAFSVRRRRNSEQKQLIGSHAASFVKNDDLLYLGAGTTMRQFANSLIARSDFERIKVVTSAINVASILAKDKRITVTLLPGVIIAPDEDLIAIAHTYDVLRSYYFDKSITGTSGITTDQGIFMPEHSFAAITKLAYQQSAKKIILADHSKFNVADSYVVCGIDCVDRIIVDRHANVEEAVSRSKDLASRIEYA